MGETTNLASTEKLKVTSLAAELGNYLRSVDAQMPTNTNTGKLVSWPDSQK